MSSQFVFVLNINIKRAFPLFDPHEISVLVELALGHLHYHLTDVPPQSNSPPDNVFRKDQPTTELTLNQKPAVMQMSTV